MIALPLRLEVLQYEVSWAVENASGEPLVPRALIPGLRVQATTLRKLVISADEWAREELGGFDHNDLELGSLVFLEVLEELTLDLRLLLPRRLVDSFAPHAPKDGEAPRPQKRASFADNPLDALLPQSLTHLTVWAPTFSNRAFQLWRWRFV